MGKAVSVQAFRYCLGLGWKVGVRVHLGSEAKEIYSQIAYDNSLTKSTSIANSTAVCICCAYEAIGISANLITIN